MTISDLTALLKNSLRAIGITAALTLVLCRGTGIHGQPQGHRHSGIHQVRGRCDRHDHGGRPEREGEGQGDFIEAGVTGRALRSVLSILDVQGYTAVRSGQVIRIVPSKDARSSPVPIMDDQSAVGNDEYVTQVIRLDNISAAKLIPVLRPLVPQQAHLAAYAPSNAIIISDIRSNIGRIVDIIERMDRSAIQTTEIIRLKYGVAEDVVSMLNTLEKSRQVRAPTR